jgi:cytochrome c-type biogenesis protein CcmH
MKRWLSVCAALALVTTAALGAPPEVPLNDPFLEARAQNLAREIRCVVCENEPVALSSADIAVDMRAAIRARVKAGDSDAQVRRYFAERYGEFVLLRPRFGVDTLALWGAPLALLLLGGGTLFLMSRRQIAGGVGATQSDNDETAHAALAALSANHARDKDS